MLNGIIVIDKEPGYTSFDVVAKMRGICRQKKVGHTGTLDPDATGVLPVCLGKATRVSGILTDSDKEYEAVMQLGVVTDTQDSSGNVLQTAPVSCSEDEVRKAILSFQGQIEQIPPMYSALKVNGQKLCDLAREGIEVERKSRPITIYGIDILSMELPMVSLRINCSKGTYIRTLCHDIGQKLGCGACMASLRRTKAAGYRLKDAYSLAEVEAAAGEGRLEQLVHRIDSVFEEYERISVRATGTALARNGNPLAMDQVCLPETPALDGQIFRVYLKDGSFVGLFIFRLKEQQFRPYKMFLEEQA